MITAPPAASAAPAGSSSSWHVWWARHQTFIYIESAVRTNSPMLPQHMLRCATHRLFMVSASRSKVCSRADEIALRHLHTLTAHTLCSVPVPVCISCRCIHSSRTTQVEHYVLIHTEWTVELSLCTVALSLLSASLCCAVLGRNADAHA